MSPRPLKIGLVFGYGLSFYRDILRGIKSYAETRPRWIFTPITPDPEAVEALRPLDHDGYIAHIFTPALGRSLARLRKPVVNVAGVLPDLTLPRIAIDHEEVGRQAAEHLLDRSLRHFGFVGYADHAFSIDRERGFRESVESRGFEVDAYHAEGSGQIDPTGLWRWEEKLQRWLSRRKRPVGILSSHDLQGVQLSEACRRAGLRVPDDVALVGVDNDDLLCEMARPALSSVALPGERIGHEAGKLLDRLIADPNSWTPGEMLRLPPLGVVTRRSSDLLAIEDEDVADAVRFIRSSVGKAIGVVDVLREVPVSRRSLERRFRDEVGRGIGEEIRRGRLERAKSLLVGGEMPIAEVARNSGFTEAKHLSEVFRRETGLTPTEFRQRGRPRA